MKPTEILKNEHRIIEIVLQALDSIANRALFEHTVDAESVRQALDFFQNFADRCHHGKEEDHLFTWMESHGFPRHGGPTGVMLQEHEQGRTHIRAMWDSVDGAAKGETNALKRFIEHARGYVGLLREHIQKEDHCLFSMADQAMSETDRLQLMQAFENAEREDIGEGVHELYVMIAKSLAEKFQIDTSSLSCSVFQCGCGH